MAPWAAWAWPLVCCSVGWWPRSRGLLEGVDDLLQDVGAVIRDLLQDGVGKLLQLHALPLPLLQLLVQLQGHTETWSAPALKCAH